MSLLLLLLLFFTLVCACLLCYRSVFSISSISHPPTHPPTFPLPIEQIDLRILPITLTGGAPTPPPYPPPPSPHPHSRRGQLHLLPHSSSSSSSSSSSLEKRRRENVGGWALLNDSSFMKDSDCVCIESERRALGG